MKASTAFVLLLGVSVLGRALAQGYGQADLDKEEEEEWKPKHNEIMPNVGLHVPRWLLFLFAVALFGGATFIVKKLFEFDEERNNPKKKKSKKRS